MARSDGAPLVASKRESEEKKCRTNSDARGWDEEAYRQRIISDRSLSYRTVFRALFSPSSSFNSGPDTVVVACSDGSLSAYSLASCVSAASGTGTEYPLLDPLCVIQAHKGPVYDLEFYGDARDALLFSCGDDGHVRAWNWNGMQNRKLPLSIQGDEFSPVLDMINPQLEGPWGARSPIPENNAIAINQQEGSVYSAAGDGCAYNWDVATGKCKMVFKGHSDYLHTVAACQLTNQIITGSEDGTVRIWDCKSGKCTRVIKPEQKQNYKENSWISCVSVDPTESWLACGSSRRLSVYSLLSNECVFSIECSSPVQDLLFDNNQILVVGSEPVLSRYTINGKLVSQIKCATNSPFSLDLHPSGLVAVGGCGGVVDIISEYGSHLCTFACKGLDSSK
ncbi:hypothetical protein LUZ60_013573 [Juncus effusus]|nr:hypothetical protein LUZ60_013573 [Juncus effusus]